MLHDEVIRFLAAQNFLDVIQPLVGKTGVNRIHDSDFIVHDHI